MPRRTTATAAPAPAQTHYGVLGVDPRCSTAEIKKAYQKIALKNHSDKLVGLDLNDEAKAQATALFIAANAAQEILLNEVLRKAYDCTFALKGLALGDRFGNTKPWVKDCDEDSDGDSDAEIASSEEEERTYAKVYQGTHAGLSWEDGILKFLSLGWDLQIQLEETFADIVRGEISNTDTLHEELHLFLDIKRYEGSDYRKKGAANDENKRGKSALSVLMSRTPGLRKLKSLTSERTWGEGDQETLYFVFELWPCSDEHKHEELEFADLDIDVALDFPIDEEDHTGASSGGRDTRGGVKNKKAGYASLTLQKLKELYRERGLRLSGRATDLVLRLEEDDAGEEQKTRKKKTAQGTIKGGSAAHAHAGGRMANQRGKGGSSMR